MTRHQDFALALVFAASLGCTTPVVVADPDAATAGALDAAVSLDGGATPSDAWISIDGGATPSDAWTSPDAALPRTCRDVVGASGRYTIDTDGAGVRAPFRVWCDMTTLGGGWTVIFLAGSSNFNTTTLDYSVDDESLRTLEGTEVLMGHRDDTMALLTGWSRFAIPAEWQEMSPFQHQAVDVEVDAELWNGTSLRTNLKFGWAYWSTFAPGSWLLDGSREGVVALTGTGASSYADFAESREDYCGTTDDWMSDPCSDVRQFSIAVRSP